MAFQAPTIQRKKNPKARIAVIGALLLVASVMVSLNYGYEKYALWGFAVSILLIVIGAVRTKGDLTDIEISTTVLLTVSRESICVGDATYAMGAIKNLEFNVKGYAGMSTDAKGMPAGASSDGGQNRVKFEYLGEEVWVWFYLGSAADVQALGLLFRELYAGHVPFVEMLKGYRSFMLQPMSEKEIEDAKVVNGY